MSLNVDFIVHWDYLSENILPNCELYTKVIQVIEFSWKYSSSLTICDYIIDFVPSVWGHIVAFCFLLNMTKDARMLNICF